VETWLFRREEVEFSREGALEEIDEFVGDDVDSYAMTSDNREMSDLADARYGGYRYRGTIGILDRADA